MAGMDGSPISLPVKEYRKMEVLGFHGILMFKILKMVPFVATCKNSRIAKALIEQKKYRSSYLVSFKALFWRVKVHWIVVDIRKDCPRDAMSFGQPCFENH